MQALANVPTTALLTEIKSRYKIFVYIGSTTNQMNNPEKEFDLVCKTPDGPTMHKMIEIGLQILDKRMMSTPQKQQLNILPSIELPGHPRFNGS